MRGQWFRCRPSARLLLMLVMLLGFIAYCYYSLPGSKKSDNSVLLAGAGGRGRALYQEHAARHPIVSPHTDDNDATTNQLEQCPVLMENSADIDTVTTFPTFEFQLGWIRNKEFWDRSFEDRYERLRNDTSRPPLKVILVPHSHNDPGWLMVFEQYFDLKSNHIINNIVDKLTEHRNMTFIWTEIAFLNSWWERSHPMKQKALKKLVQEGRLEITTGGWVMPDEATTHIYSLVDQFIEGHQWVKDKLGVVPQTGWSIDPFGHGPTVPHLLDQAGLQGAVIQRIHYAWKQWLARQQVEDFHWVPGWDTRRPSLVVHNQPFDIYSIKASCGPHPAVCLGYDFRNVIPQFARYSLQQEEVTDRTLPAKARTLLEEYQRAGSLTPHNVVLVPLGDDFRYEFADEFDAQYRNYKKLFDYINARPQFNAELRFGTPRDYFRAVRRRQRALPTLRGDFFVYSDIFTEGRPAYWSGYFTTRPYIKQIARHTEHQLRSAEILFTLVSNLVRREPARRAEEKRLEKMYERLVGARRNLGLFQHHDAITGTSKAFVMHDYGTKLVTSLYHCLRLQERALAAALAGGAGGGAAGGALQAASEWESYGAAPRGLRVSLLDRRRVVLFNSLLEERAELVVLRARSAAVRVRDLRRGRLVPLQVEPVWEAPAGAGAGGAVSDAEFELVFEALVPALSAVVFAVEEDAAPALAAVYCEHCAGSERFPPRAMQPGDLQLENSALQLLVSRRSGLLRQVLRKDSRRKTLVDVHIGAYQSAQRHSGAYLFKPDHGAPEKDVLAAYAGPEGGAAALRVVSGAVRTELCALYPPLLAHCVALAHGAGAAAARLTTRLDLQAPPRHRDEELFLRLQTDIQNGDPPEFYTDQNGFQYQRRVKTAKLGVEAHYYPVTTMAWLQDARARLTVVTGHAQGAAAFEPGRLELMLDRRTLYDDLRGMGEGVVDNRPTTFTHWLLLEEPPAAPAPPRPAERRFNAPPPPRPYALPSAAADALSRATNYPLGVFLVDEAEAAGAPLRPHRAFAERFPPGLHLLGLRTLTDDILDQFPSSSCLMTLQRPGRACPPAGAAGAAGGAGVRFSADSRFSDLPVRNLTAVSLTGLATRRRLKHLQDIRLKPMDLKTYQIWF